jgi:hypothetical protein
VDVASIITAPEVEERGGKEAIRTYVFRFRDGSSWASAWAPERISIPVQAALAQFVSEKSSVPISERTILRAKDF